MRTLDRRNLIKAAGVAGGASLLAARGQPAQARGSRMRTTVFERFEGEYQTFRVPRAALAKDGTLLMFADGKQAGPDFVPTELVLKRSTDGGRTWGPLQVVAPAPPKIRIGGAPVVDHTTGRIVVLITWIDLENRDRPPRAFRLHSDDNGATWSDPSDWEEITDQVALPDWQHFVVGWPHGIQLRHGPQAGRLLYPGWFRRPAPQDGDPAIGGVYLPYSDDGGDSWQVGALDEHPDGRLNIGEAAVVELADGTVYANTRNQRAVTPEHRAATRSSDGGVSFDRPFEVEPDLVTPLVSASLLSATRRWDRSERILFCSEDHPSSRERLALWSSLDEGTNWHESLLVYDGPAGYTDLVGVDSDVIGVAAETGPRLGADGGLSYHQTITFSRVPLALLDRPSPPRPGTPDMSGNGHDAVISGRPKVVPGRVGRAFAFAGNYVEVPLSDPLLMGAEPFTVAVWFRTRSGENQRIANAYDYGGHPGWTLEVSQDRVRSGFTTDAISADLRASEDFTDGQWHHVALRRDGGDIATLFVDGQEIGSESVDGSVSAGAFAPIRLGARLEGINDPLVGALDDFLLYRRGLSAVEVAALAAGNSPPPAERLLVHLPLDRRVGRGR